VKDIQPATTRKTNTLKKGMVVIGGILVLSAFVINTSMTWGQYDVWGKITQIDLVLTIPLLFFPYVYFMVEDPTLDTKISFSHPIPNIIVRTSLMLILLTAVISYWSHFQYQNILWSITSVLFDLSCILLLQNMIRQRMQKKKS